MAFPLPTHLPRKLDVSSQILSKLDSVTTQTLSSSVASSWRRELDASITLTKKRIHDCIHENPQSFEKQLSSSLSSQTRIRSLSGSIEDLNNVLTTPESGLIPTLTNSLIAHQSLAQASLNADVLHSALVHLSKCDVQLASLRDMVDEGNLPVAAKACTLLNDLLASGPEPTSKAVVTVDMKKTLHILNNRVEELLSNASSDSLIVSPSQIVIHSSVSIAQSTVPLTTASILTSLSLSSLTSKLATLRRDLTSHYIDYLLEQPTSLTVSSTHDSHGSSVSKLERFHAPPSTFTLGSRLDNLSILLDFLREQLFPMIPESQQETFPRSLRKPLTSAILTRLLIPSLPSSLEALPTFLDLARKAVGFEKTYIVDLLGDGSTDQEIKTWVDNVNVHYEKQRRQDILGALRLTVTQSTGIRQTFYAQMKAIQDISAEEPSKPEENGTDADSDAWGLDDNQSIATSSSKSISVEDDSGWGFDDDVEEPGPDTVPEAEPMVTSDMSIDADDAWGWNDDSGDVEEQAAADNGSQDKPEEEEENVWDDPWGDNPALTSSTSSTRPPAAPSIPLHQPKPAVGLQKITSKTQSHSGINGNGSIANGHSTPIPSSTPQPIPDRQQSKSLSKSQTLEQEPYRVSFLTKTIIGVVEGALHEGKALASSGIFNYSPTSSSLPGTLIMQTAGLALDLYRAFYPISLGNGNAIQFSNDCFYLAEEINRIVTYERGVLAVKDKLEECGDQLKVLSDSLFYDSIEQVQESSRGVLAAAEGFIDTSDQDRYDSCEMAMTRVLREIRSTAQGWKPLMPKSKYYNAIGAVVEDVLGQILEDVLALQDIPEIESHKLSELCRILGALEGLFIEDTSESSFVVAHVPSWLKFSYLSELLEASMADLTYLFEEAALVDFEIDELVKLVRALFADTPLRTTTLNKIERGHPVR
ncbi:hypothetical protein BJ138DRAFT_1055180 [Hygrophoropsis aurantiaca]|uniref:Uncharacterized protein n=1 Tax=Hygrophoropsis aurantiaca TaxID=72124 RepID=A0ACB8AQI0_9AGAM|nr:hypothetical protein BJ138DRAFT_1055180 [Hygrophoropsis aurantiaca]